MDTEPEGQGHRLTIASAPSIARFIVEKGYVTLDGVGSPSRRSRTVASTIALIPETSAARRWARRPPRRARTTLEVDPVARYAYSAASAYVNGGASSDELAWAFEI